MKSLTYLLPLLLVSKAKPETSIIPQKQTPQVVLEKSAYAVKDEPWRKQYSIRFVNETESAVTVYGPTAISPSGAPIDAVVTIEPHSEGILNTSIWIQDAEIKGGIALSFTSDLASFQIYGFAIFTQFGARDLNIDRQFLINNSGSTPPTMHIGRWIE